MPFEHGLTLARGIPDARFVALESKNRLILSHELARARFVDEICGFLGEVEPRATHGGRVIERLSRLSVSSRSRCAPASAISPDGRWLYGSIRYLGNTPLSDGARIVRLNMVRSVFILALASALGAACSRESAPQSGASEQVPPHPLQRRRPAQSPTSGAAPAPGAAQSPASSAAPAPAPAERSGGANISRGDGSRGNADLCDARDPDRLEHEQGRRSSQRDAGRGDYRGRDDRGAGRRGA